MEKLFNKKIILNNDKSAATEQSELSAILLGETDISVEYCSVKYLLLNFLKREGYFVPDGYLMNLKPYLNILKKYIIIHDIYLFYGHLKISIF